MADIQVERISALAGHYRVGRFDTKGEVGVTFAEAPNLTLHQVAAWADTMADVGAMAAGTVGADAAPGPGLAAVGGDGALLRIEPLKFWIVGRAAPELTPDQGATLDLSHSRCHLQISGLAAVALLNSYLPLDLRACSFPVGSVASTAFHHVGVTLWRSETAFELFTPRSFALSLWQLLLEGAVQFGFEVTGKSTN